MRPPSPPSAPPRASNWPCTWVLPLVLRVLDQTTTVPPWPLFSAEAFKTAPGFTITSLAWRMSGFWPCQSPPIKTLPPPAWPLASTRAWLPMVTLSPVTTTSPPFVPAAAPAALIWPAMSTWPCGPPSKNTRPSRFTKDKASIVPLC